VVVSIWRGLTIFGKITKKETILDKKTVSFNAKYFILSIQTLAFSD